MNGYVALLISIPLVVLAVCFFLIKKQAEEREKLIGYSGFIEFPDEFRMIFHKGLYSLCIPRLDDSRDLKTTARFIADLQAFIRQTLTAGIGVVVAIVAALIYASTLWQLPVWPDISFGNPETGWHALGILLLIVVKVIWLLFVAVAMLLITFYIFRIAHFLITNIVYRYLIYGSLLNAVLVIVSIMSDNLTSLQNTPMVLLVVVFVLSDIGDISVFVLESIVSSVMEKGA